MFPPKISVIIPVKNRANLISYTLDNILNQSKPPDEVIVIDDHSSDNLFEVLEPYKNRVIYLKSSKHGPGAARNEGLNIATGDYIQFFDSDDLMTNNKLEAQSKILSESENSIVIGPYVKAIEENGKWHQLDVVMQYKNLPEHLGLDEWILRGWCSITQACMFKKEIIKDAGFWREDMMTHEDLEYWFRLAKLNPYPLHTNQACVIYRQHSNQVTDSATTFENRVLDGLMALQEIQENKSRKYGFYSEIALSARIYKQLRLLAKQGTSLKNEFSYFLYRLINKKERLITGSDWERMHGINSNPSVFESYLKLLSTSV